MDPSLSSIALVSGFIAAAAVGALLYLGRGLRIERPPIGVYHLGDVVFVGIVLVVVPPLSLEVPDAIVGVVLVLVALMILQYTLAPLLGSRLAFLAAVVAVAVDVTLALGTAEGSRAFALVNNALVVVLVAGVANLYVQSGMRARDVALFAGGLAIYDVIATAWLPVMVEFFFDVIDLPIAPAIVWGTGDGLVAAGLGDVLVLVLWTLAAEKAFGRAEAIVAGVTGVVSVLGVLLLFWVDLLNSVLPAMVVLGPLVVAQYVVFLRRHGRERTVAEYFAMPDDGVAPRQLESGLSPVTMANALARLQSRGPPGGPGGYVAVAGSDIIGRGATAGEARRQATLTRPGVVPLLVWVRDPGSAEEIANAADVVRK